MLKDYCDASGTEGGEESFVGSYWDDKWRESLASLEERKQRVRRTICFSRMSALFPAAGGADILDCGTGLGEWSLVLQELHHRVIGIDIAHEQIGRLQSEFGASLFQEKSFLETGFKDESFDMVFNWGGAEHFEQGIERSLREACRVLRPGGHVLISTPAHNLRHMLKGFGKPVPANCRSDRRFYQYRYTSAEMTAELLAAGFASVTTEFFSKWQGAHRFLHEEGSFLTRWGGERYLTEALQRLLPGWLIGHMILGVGRRPR